MDNTHIQSRIRQWYARYSVHLEAFATGMVMAALLATSDTTVYQGYFLKRPVQQQTAPVHTIRSKAIVRREQRLAKLHLQKPIVKKTTVVAQADDGKPYLDTSDLRPAAPAAPVIIEIPAETSSVPAASSSSVASSVSLSSSVSSGSSSSSISSITSISPALHSSQSDAGSVAPSSNFPAFGRAMHPVWQVPNWGAMKTPAEWNRTYKQMTNDDFVRVPSYDMKTLLTPMNDLLKDRNNPENIKALTAKLYYSTRFFGAYDLDAGEFSAVHPGLDLKLAEGTPVGAVAGGLVREIQHDEDDLGLHAIIEHHAPDGQTYYSIYGHLGSVSVKAGQSVDAGQMVGAIGMTGHTTGPHLHLQIDRGEPNETHHQVYWPASMPSRAEADKHVINPIVFIRQYADGQ